jgi:hypothetical protein
MSERSILGEPSSAAQKRQAATPQVEGPFPSESSSSSAGPGAGGFIVIHPQDAPTLDRRLDSPIRRRSSDLEQSVLCKQRTLCSSKEQDPTLA